METLTTFPAKVINMPVWDAELDFKSTCSRLLEFKETMRLMSESILIYQSADLNSAMESRKAHETILLCKVLLFRQEK